MTTAENELATLLERALSDADAAGRRFVSRPTVGSATFARITELTRRYVSERAHIDEAGDLVCDSPILTWWTDAADLDDEQRMRLHKFRSAVVHDLEDRGVVERPHPQSTRMYLKRASPITEPDGAKR